LEVKEDRDLALAEEDALRAQVYSLLANLFSAPPKGEVLKMVRGLKGDETEFGQAIAAMASTAAATTSDAIEDEYNALFVGVTRGELLPYASYYLTGFTYEKPLADLRGDMARLGIARAEDIPEPEDHIAALCEMMVGLIGGAFDGPHVSLAEQRSFFDTHIGCWAPKFFEDLEAANAAAFYMPVGRIGRLFMDIEQQAFEMAA